MAEVEGFGNPDGLKTIHSNLTSSFRSHPGSDESVARASIINHGDFLQATFDFIVMAFVVFIAVKQAAGFKKEAPLLRRISPRYDDEKTHTIDAPHN